MRPFKFFFALLLCLLLAGCGQTEASTPAPDFLTEAPSVEEASPDPHDLEIVLPEEYRDLLIVTTEFDTAEEHWVPLLSVQEKASVEAMEKDFGSGAGVFICGTDTIVSNCVIRNNVADSKVTGGGVYFSPMDTVPCKDNVVVRSVIAGNSSGGSGAGVLRGEQGHVSGPLQGGGGGDAGAPGVYLRRPGGCQTGAGHRG